MLADGLSTGMVGDARMSAFGTKDVWLDEVVATSAMLCQWNIA